MDIGLSVGWKPDCAVFLQAMASVSDSIYAFYGFFVRIEPEPISALGLFLFD